jgi:peptidoglycan L-alanyl-D-glutamate endopeptidase CwlK
MSRNIDDLRREFRGQARALIGNTKDAGFQMVPYFTLRMPWEQAILWRMTRGSAEISRKIKSLREDGALYIAFVMEAVGPQYPGPGITNHVTYAVPGQSWHNWGEGMDCYLKVDGEVIWDEDHHGYVVYGDCAEELGLTWGGMWNKPNDPGHVQSPPMKPSEYFEDIAELSGSLERKYGGQLNA